MSSKGHFLGQGIKGARKRDGRGVGINPNWDKMPSTFGYPATGNQETTYVKYIYKKGVAGSLNWRALC